MKTFFRFRRILLVLILVTFLFPARASAGDRNPPPPSKKLKSATSLLLEDLSGTLSPQDLASLLVGSGVTVSNVIYTGAEAAAGRFSGGTGIIGFDSGIILSSGVLANIPGPNQVDNISSANGLEGDADLTGLSGYTTFDAAVLEFDFYPNADFVSFKFVFASDEYNEYVYSKYNDVFGFYINGQNCAFIEGDPITVNTINNGNPYDTDPRTHPNFYRNNDISDGGGSIDTEMDGLTAVLTCSAAVNPNQKNHAKLAIADASDPVFDSNVFIEAASLTTERRPIVFVPGMSASANLPCFTVEMDCDKDDSWGWMWTGDDYYNTLIQRLNGAGYTEENGYLSLFFYDWRKPIQSNVARLKSRIQKVKEQTGAEKVDLVGHSMGGLLSRAYVQDSSYAGDVSHLITLGSPHYGSAKAYPYWQAAYFYEVDPLMEIGFNLVLKYYQIRNLNPIPVLALRQAIPSFQDILPTWDYLYDGSSGNKKLESQLHERNSFLASLNANQNLLFERLGEGHVATFALEQKVTTERFYVSDYLWFLNDPKTWYYEIFNWSDGKPDWSRLDECRFTAGDGTVLKSSAQLPSPAYSPDLHDVMVDHGNMSNDKKVIDEILKFLGISVAPVTTPTVIGKALVLFLDGPANAIITDPQGNTLGSPSLSQAQWLGSSGSASAGPIPGATYFEVPGDTFKYIIIPDIVEGQYQIDVQGTAAGTYSLGVLDTFDDNTDPENDFLSGWDTVQTQTEASGSATFGITYNTQVTSTVMIAETPVIQTPVWANAAAITGRAVPGKTVEIRDATSHTVLGTATAGAEGLYQAPITTRLQQGQKIYPSSEGVDGSAVDVQLLKLYLPLLKR